MALNQFPANRTAAADGAMHWSKRVILVALVLTSIVPDMQPASAQSSQTVAFGGAVDPRFGSPTAMFNGPDPVPLNKPAPANFSGSTADFMNSFSDHSTPPPQPAPKKKPAKKARSAGWKIPPPPSIGLV